MMSTPTDPRFPFTPTQQRAPTWSVRSNEDEGLPIDVLPSGAASRGSARLDYDALTDLELLERVCRDDHRAFNAFHARFRNLIMACICRIAARLGSALSEADRSDLESEVMMNLVAHNFRRLKSYRPDRGCSVSSWVGVIASSTAHDFLRRERRRRWAPTVDGELESVALAVDGPDADLIDREERQFVDRALETFSARDRHFVDLYFVQALAPEAIAEQMGVSVSTVYSKKAKIKTRLRALAKLAA